MATPRRRSSRLRGSMTPSHTSTMAAPSTLSSLLERDESPPNAQASIDAIVSPVAPSNSFVPQQQGIASPVARETPQTASRFHVGLNEMHPSKMQQSTTKASTTDVNLGSGGAPTPSTAPAVRFSALVGENGTPTKSKGTLPSHMSSPGFDFSFDRPESDLSADAQKIMEGVREQAAKIKARMQEERDKQQSKDGEAQQLYGNGGRKIAKPKGKSGRYSDAHKQQFRKMDSIANHPSTWKIAVPAKTTSLKRSGSKAGLDDPPQAKGLSKSGSSKSLRTVADTGRLENTAPGKRAKKRADDDTSTTRPAPRYESIADSAAAETPMAEAAATKLPSAITTPTKASLARATSVKSTKGSMIPSLGRSNAIKTLASPSKSEGSNKYFSLARFGNVKSILSRHQPKFSNDPEKIAAGTHLPLPHGKIDLNELSQGKTDLNKDLPNIPGAFQPSEERVQTTKRVVFTPSTKAPQDLNITPSPSRIPALKSANPVAEPSTPSDSVTYPSLVNSPNITHRPTKTPSASTSLLKYDATPSPSKPTEFTFTSPRTLNFSAPTSVSKLKFGAPTIRQVRPSGITTPLAPFDTTHIPAIPHGMANKKRKHVDSDDDEDMENVAPGSTINNQKSFQDRDKEDEGPRAKKVKMTTTSERRGMATPQKSPQKKFGAVGSRIPKAGSATTTPKGKGKSVLSLSRLNMLARPKDRR